MYRSVSERARMAAPVLMDRRHTALKAFGVRAVPTTFILDGKGHVTKRLIGGHSKATFIKAIEAAK